MKLKILFGLLLLAAVGVGAFFLGRSTAHDHAAAAPTGEKTLYTCGMHPQVIQDHPGRCPICGMKLTPIKRSPGGTTAAASSGERKIKYYKSTMIPGEVRQTPGKDSMGMDMVPVYEDEAAAAEASMIAIDPVTIQNLGIRTTEVTRGPLRRTIRTVGIVEHSEAALADVTTKFSGWLEKLYVDVTGQHVHRGDPLFEIYSPELYSAQTEYLLALELTGEGAEALQETARRKLKFWDISDEQIAELERTHQPRKTLRIQAPIDGYVMEKMAVEGQQVEPGRRLYRLANHDTIWVQGQVYEQDLPFVRLGQEASVTVAGWPDLKFRGRVTFILPELDQATRTVKVRMEFHNPGHILRPGMFATARLVADVAPAVVLVPDSAVLRSGEKNTVFVARAEGKFEPRTVVLGRAADDGLYEVVSGLTPGERVVTSGQFMLDSESQLREAIQKMLAPRSPAPPEKPSPPSRSPDQTSGPPLAPAPPPLAPIYICPMPEHVAIEHAHPGKCSLCGMGLVPVSPELLARIQPGGKIEGYTCPMPEHSDVRSAQPGKCPKCGMTLVPIMSLPALPEEPAQLYTCPMASHADVVSDRPGKCPKCDMDLVPTHGVRHGKLAEENWRKQQADRHEH